MSEIFLIRHGQASFGEKDYDRLSPVGVRQARILADHLFAQNFRFDAVYSGSLKRQKDTAHALCRRYAPLEPERGKPAVCGAFDEYDARAMLFARSRQAKDPKAVSIDDLDRLRRDRRAFQAYFSDTANRWIRGDLDDAPGLETWPGFCARVIGGIQRIIADHGPGKRVAVFTSGGAISVVMKRALDLADRTTMETSWQIMNASLTSVRYNGDRLTLSTFNNTTHLLLEKDPALMTYR